MAHFMGVGGGIFYLEIGGGVKSLGPNNVKLIEMFIHMNIPTI